MENTNSEVSESRISVLVRNEARKSFMVSGFLDTTVEGETLAALARQMGGEMVNLMAEELAAGGNFLVAVSPLRALPALPDTPAGVQHYGRIGFLYPVRFSEYEKGTDKVSSEKGGDQ